MATHPSATNPTPTTCGGRSASARCLVPADATPESLEAELEAMLSDELAEREASDARAEAEAEIDEQIPGTELAPIEPTDDAADLTADRLQRRRAGRHARDRVKPSWQRRRRRAAGAPCWATRRRRHPAAGGAAPAKKRCRSRSLMTATSCIRTKASRSLRRTGPWRSDRREAARRKQGLPTRPAAEARRQRGSPSTRLASLPSERASRRTSRSLPKTSLTKPLPLRCIPRSTSRLRPWCRSCRLRDIDADLLEVFIDEAREILDHADACWRSGMPSRS